MLGRFLSIISFFGIVHAGVLEGATIAGEDKRRLPLGTAFDADGSRLLPRTCVEGSIKRANDRRATFHVDYAKDFDTMQKSIDRLASGGFDIGLFGASSSVEYFARIYQSKLRESLLLEFHAQDGSLYLGPDLAAQPALNLLDKSGMEKREICGTEYVQQVDLGYRMFINITLNFSDENNYELYKKTTKISALWGLISSSRTTIDELKKYAKTLHIEVDALQEGGDKRFVNNILSNDHQCSAEGLDRCLSIFTKLSCYMNAAPGSTQVCDPEAGLGVPQGFNQVMQDASQRSYLEADGPTILRYVTMPYEDAGIDDLADADDQPLPDADILRSHSESLTQALVERISLRQRIHSSLDFEFSNDKATLNHYLESVDEDILELKDALKACQESNNVIRCQSKAQAALKDQAKFEDTLLFPLSATS